MSETQWRYKYKFSEKEQQFALIDTTNEDAGGMGLFDGLNRLNEQEQYITALERDLTAAQEREAKLREALEQYANKSNWLVDSYLDDEWQGRGRGWEIAQAALAATQGEAA